MKTEFYLSVPWKVYLMPGLPSVSELIDSPRSFIARKNHGIVSVKERVDCNTMKLYLVYFDTQENMMRFQMEHL